MQEQHETRLALAHHYLDIGDDESALAALGDVANDALADPDYWFVRTAALRGLNRAAEAVDAARRGLELDPTDTSLLDSLALAEIDRDRFTEAERALRTALELEPEDANLHAHLAVALAETGRYVEARRRVHKSLQLAPENGDALRVRVLIAFRADEDPSTIRAYTADLLRVFPDDQSGHLMLGTLSAREMDFRRSAQEFAEAARINPSMPGLAAGARETRVLAHPVLAPVRSVWRFGRWRAYFLVIVLSATLAAVHQPVLRGILLTAWLVIIALSWLAPPILRRIERRRYGG